MATVMRCLGRHFNSQRKASRAKKFKKWPCPKASITGRFPPITPAVAPTPAPPYWRGEGQTSLGQDFQLMKTSPCQAFLKRALRPKLCSGMHIPPRARPVLLNWGSGAQACTGGFERGLLHFQSDSLSYLETLHPPRNPAFYCGPTPSSHGSWHFALVSLCTALLPTSFLSLCCGVPSH